MKTRSGFVSNSSSSSFIVGFPKKPKSVEETFKMLFPYHTGEETIKSYIGTVSYNRAAEIVFNDLKKQRTATKKKIFEMVDSGWFEGAPEYNWDSSRKISTLVREFEKKFPKIDYWNDTEKMDNLEAKQMAQEILKLSREERKERDDLRTKAAQEYIKKITPRFKNQKVYVFSYCDNEIEGSVMEHYGIFNALPHVTISNH